MTVTMTSQLTAPLRSANASDVYSALIKIGKEDHRELEAEIVPFLDSDNAELRSAAIRVLGFYWKLPAYRERAAEMVRSERDADARSVAIMAWSSYHADTKNVDVLKTVHALTLDTTQRFPVRSAAYAGMMVVSGIPAAERAKAMPRGSMDESINWELMRRMLAGTGIDVPVKESSPVATLGVRKFIYENGNAQSPNSYFGRIVMTFHGETGLVELEQEQGPNRRAWQANMPPETWSNLLATLQRYEFPKAPVIVEAPVPGSLASTLTWERHGELEALTFAGRTPDYSDVNRIVFSIVAQMAPALLRGEPSEWSFPNTRVELSSEVKVEP